MPASPLSRLKLPQEVRLESELTQQFGAIGVEGRGRGAGRWVREGGELERVAGELERAGLGVLDRDQHVAGLDLRMRERAVDRVDGPAGHAALADDSDPLLRRLLLELTLDLG